MGPSIPSSSTPFGCPSLPPSSVPLAVSLPLASRGRSRSRTLETLYLDMFDCQFLMATFVNVYIHSFINLPTPGKIIQQVFLLLPEEQLELFRELEASLLQRGILQP